MGESCLTFCAQVNTSQISRLTQGMRLNSFVLASEIEQLVLLASGSKELGFPHSQLTPWTIL